MYLNIFENGEKAELEALSIAPTSLYHAFEQVTDGRKSKGKRYPLPLLLTLLLLGKLAGETKINGIVDWIKERKEGLRAQLDWPKRFPTNSTFSEALARCDAEQIATVLAQVNLKAQAVEQCGTEPSRLQAHKQARNVDTCGNGWQNLTRHTGTSQRRAASVPLLGLYECHSGIVLAQRAGEEQRKCASAQQHPCLIPRESKGRIISTDALHTQKKWCTSVHL